MSAGPDVAADAPPPPPRDWRTGFAVQLVVTIVATTAIQAVRPTMTYRALSLGASPVEIGLIQSAYSVIPAFTAVLIGRWIDRAGRSRYLMLSLFALTSGAVVATFAPGLVVLGIAQMVLGLGQIVYLVAGQSLIANTGPRDGREARYGHYTTAVSLGQLIGPSVAAAIVGSSVAVATVGLLASAGPGPGPIPGAARGVIPDVPEANVFFIAAVMFLVAGVLAAFVPIRRRRAAAGAVPAEPAAQPALLAMAGQVLRRPGMLSAMLVSVTVVSAIDVLVAYLPAYGEDVGISVALVGTLLSVRAGASLLSRFLMTRLIARFGRSRLLAASMAMAGAGLLVPPLTASGPALIASMVVVGFGLGLGQPMTIAWVANRSRRAERATALGVRLTGNRTALLIVPTAMGIIAGTAGITAIFLVVAASLALGTVVAMTTSFDDPPPGAGATPGSAAGGAVEAGAVEAGAVEAGAVEAGAVEGAV